MPDQKKSFSPLLFLASLGAGGISVVPFSLFQYSIPHGKGLITFAQMNHGTYPLWQEFLYYGLEGGMGLFLIIHLVLSVYFLNKYISWRRTPAFKEMLNDPTKNAALLVPYISAIMTMNTFLAGIRFFVPILSDNLQKFMLPAFIVWGVLWIMLILTVLKLLKIAFSTNFDVRKISFGWLLYPFSLSMLAVTGTGFAAVAKDPSIAHTAALLSLVPLTMAFFLFVVKMVAIFTSHFQADNLPEKQFMPSFLSAIPVITLMSISLYRMGHYLHTYFNYHIGPFYFWVVVAAFAFEIWYLLFGLSMMTSYFKKDFFKNEYYFSQWALVCPFVAFAVLGAFVYSVFIQSPLFIAGAVVSLVVAMSLFFKLLFHHFLCKKTAVKALSVKEIYQCV
jgi:tellurite resistance protein TehA-like permease